MNVYVLRHDIWRIGHPLARWNVTACAYMLLEMVLWHLI